MDPRNIPSIPFLLRRRIRGSADAIRAWSCEGAAAVAIDIFDTALLRGVRVPRDALLLSAWRVCRRSPAGVGFAALAAARIAAERNARKFAHARGIGEVTLDEIYAMFPPHIPRATAAALREEEPATERDVCHANPEMLRLYDELLGRGIAVGFLSDTYHSAEFLDRLLREKGFAGSHRVFASSEFRETKASGRLYARLASRLALPPNRILHIGDNARSDVVNARRQGFRALWYRPGLDARPFRTTPRARTEDDLKSSLMAGIAASLPMRGSGDRRIWERIGTTVAAPLYLAFTRWLQTGLAADRPDHVFFFARDGRIVREVYEMLREAGVECPQSTYLLVSRRALVFPSLCDVGRRELDFLCSYQLPLPVHEFLARAGLDPKTCAGVVVGEGLTLDAVIETRADRERLRRVFLRLKGDILERANFERPRALAYLLAAGCGRFESFAVCDIGWRGTMQAALCSILRREGLTPRISGFYVATATGARNDADIGGASRGWLSNAGRPERRRRLVEGGTAVLELLFTAAHGSVTGYSEEGDPVRPTYRPNGAAKEYAAAAQQIQEAALQFVRRYLAAFGGGPPIDIGEAAAVAALRRLALRPSKREAAAIGALVHVDGFGPTESGQPLAEPILRLGQSGWIAAFQRSFSRSPWPHGFLVRITGSARISALLVGLRRLLLRLRRRASASAAG